MDIDHLLPNLPDWVIALPAALACLLAYKLGRTFRPRCAASRPQAASSVFLFAILSAIAAAVIYRMGAAPCTVPERVMALAFVMLAPAAGCCLMGTVMNSRHYVPLGDDCDTHTSDK